MGSNMASDKKRDDIRRTTRIIQIDEMLRGGAFVGMDELVFKFGVNKRTVERDFERLRDEMNAPLEYDKTRKMYHYTDPTFSVPNVVLTEGELFTVSNAAFGAVQEDAARTLVQEYNDENCLFSAGHCYGGFLIFEHGHQFYFRPAAKNQRRGFQ